MIRSDGVSRERRCVICPGANALAPPPVAGYLVLAQSSRRSPLRPTLSLTLSPPSHACRSPFSVGAIQEVCEECILVTPGDSLRLIQSLQKSHFGLGSS